MSASIRAGSIAPFAGTARGLALNPAALQGRAGLDPADVENADGKLPAAAVAALLQSAAAEAGRADFGLMMAQSWSLADLGPRQPGGGVSGHPARGPDRPGPPPPARVGGHRPGPSRGQPGRPDQDIPGPAAGAERAQLVEFTAGVAIKLCRIMLGAGWLPTGVRFRHAGPLDLAPHRRLLGGQPPEFDAPVDAVLLKRGELDVKAPRMLDPALRRHAEALLEHLPSSRSESMAERAARVIRSRLADGSADLANVARCLDLNGRTFQRRLQAEGLGFSDLLDQVRAEVAKACLADGDLPLHQIAERLGYADGSAFTRWFSCKFGLPPSRWREDARNGPCGAGERRSA
ncbi:MAG: AraC family transcriptional regulator ligand-binding domain-containing protein [Caulobacteraceae bacterium]